MNCGYLIRYVFKPRLRITSEAADLFQQPDPGSVTSASPVGTYTSLVPSPYNSGIVLPISDTEFEVDVNFSGILDCSIFYNADAVATELITPYFTITGGSDSTDVTRRITLLPSPITASAPNYVDLAGNNGTGYSRAIFRLGGGLDATHVPPTISIIGMNLTGDIDDCAILFSSLPENVLNMSLA